MFRGVARKVESVAQVVTTRGLSGSDKPFCERYHFFQGCRVDGVFSGVLAPCARELVEKS